MYICMYIHLYMYMHIYTYIVVKRKSSLETIDIYAYTDKQMYLNLYDYLSAFVIKIYVICRIITRVDSRECFTHSSSLFF